MTIRSDAPPDDKAPYVGPRPFQTGERLFGRDREIQDLFDLLSVERVVLVHSPSGAGKTSLIQAGLIPRLTRENFRIYKPLRVSQEPTSEETKSEANRHVLSVLRGLDASLPSGGAISPETLRELTLPRFFKDWNPTAEDSRDEFLFFDQFEEILTTAPEDRGAKRAFFDQIGSILRAPQRHAIFAMREEFVAALDPYLSRIPRGLATRFHLDLLEATAARQAIVGPAQAFGVTIEDAAAEALIDDLRMIRVQEPDGSALTRPGLFVEPVQLQIVCLRLWESRQGADRIGEQDVNNAVGSVDNALAGYYAEKVKAIAVGAIARGKGISEWDIRTWFERQLITEDNVRGQLRKEKNATRGLDNRVIEALIDVYLVRAEERRSITWYELAHDRLIEPIRKSNAAWMKSFKTNLPASSTAPDRVDIQEALRSTLGSSATADLEIGLHRTNDGRYVVELRLRRMDQGDLAPIRGETSLDFDALRFADNDGYGRLLSQALFADPKVRESFGMVRGAVVQAANAALRVRLFIAAGAPELHYLKWELLQDPDSGEPLLTSGTILFSRYASNYDWRPVRMRPMTDLRALVVVANPADVADDRPEGGPLSPFDVPGELARAKSELGEIPASEVTGPVTIDRLVGALRDEYDILYLVARGDWIDGEPRLWLENEEGHAEVISGSDLAKRLGELLVQPRLVILASRQHAGHGDDTLADDGGALAAMGPRLAEAGVLAVIAMQASITRATCARFFPSFFHELRRSGQIDRAMAVARVDVRDRPDYWVPVLFTRISDGRIWYVQGFSSARRREDESQTWKALVKQIEVGKCIPIIGSGLLEGLIGSIHEIARLWSEEVGSLPSPRRLEDLPQVAQYLSVMYDRYFTYQSLEKLLREQLARRFNDLPIEAALDDLLQAARVRLRDSSRMEPHDVLARLPFPLYITFNPDDQLRRALIAAGKQPILERFERGEYRDYDRPSIFDSEPSYVPTVERPLVYHMYGQLQEPDSLVLTEDDYFEHLLGLTRSQMAKRLPLSNDLDVLTVVLGALASSAKLFLGFRMENWDFAFSIRSITTFGGGNRRSKFKDVIVMREPEQNLSPNSEKAREYYERYLRGSYNLDSYVRTSHIDVYWGTVEDFLQDLGEQLLKKP